MAIEDRKLANAFAGAQPDVRFINAGHAHADLAGDDEVENVVFSSGS
jgi:hypothetical protein